MNLLAISAPRTSAPSPLATKGHRRRVGDSRLSRLTVASGISSNASRHLLPWPLERFWNQIHSVR